MDLWDKFGKKKPDPKQEIYIITGSAEKGYNNPINVEQMDLVELSAICKQLLELCSTRYAEVVKEKEND